MIYKGVPIPYPFIRHIDKVTGRFFAADNKAFIREFRKSDIFQAVSENDEQIPGGLDNPAEFGYIPPLS
jgi:hypothetical protein